MKILISHLGNPCDCLISSSLNRGLRKRYKDAKIDWVVLDESSRDMIRFNSTGSRSYTFDKFKFDRKYDMFVNLHSEVKDEYGQIECADKRGVGYSSDSIWYKGAMSGRLKTAKNIFQIYFNIAGITWSGEGYDVSYMPRSKSKKNRAGLAISNSNLRSYVRENLDLSTMKTWVIPYRKNVLKKMDEINKCKHVVTDDWLTMNMALSLRKYVYFLNVMPVGFSLEMFGSGHVYNIDRRMVR